MPECLGTLYHTLIDEGRNQPGFFKWKVVIILNFKAIFTTDFDQLLLGVPTMVIVGQEGEIINYDANSDISNDPEGKVCIKPATHKVTYVIANMPTFNILYKLVFQSNCCLVDGRHRPTFLAFSQNLGNERMHWRCRLA